MGRRELTGVAAGVLGSFISRNNDVDGYWALGQLRAECDARNATTRSLDLLAGTSSLDGRVASRVAASFREVLLRHLQRLEFAAEQLRLAHVLLEFAPPTSTKLDAYASYGSPFRCVVQLEDDRGHVYRREYAGRRAVHDPRGENRSTRA
jgi:hypothetical protein